MLAKNDQKALSYGYFFIELDFLITYLLLKFAVKSENSKYPNLKFLI